MNIFCFNNDFNVSILLFLIFPSFQVDCIYDAVKKSTDSGSPVNVEILLECTRGSRGSPNSRSMLLPLIRHFSNAVKVSLYHAPELRGLLKLIPERFNETLALTHLKVYLTDNTVILSG